MEPEIVQRVVAVLGMALSLAWAFVLWRALVKNDLGLDGFSKALYALASIAMGVGLTFVTAVVVFFFAWLLWPFLT